MRVLIIGLDAFDPTIFERLNEAGRLPNLRRYVAKNGYSRFTVSNPPQSEVSWTSIATGLNPGGHGMFDFVHRDPATYALNVSLLPTKSGLTGTQFAEPYDATTIFDQAVAKGFPATVLWWPAMFPARLKSPVRSLPGLGTPDLLGRLGVGVFFTTATRFGEKSSRKTPVAPLEKSGKTYSGKLAGPMRKGRDGLEPSTLDVRIEPTSAKTARVTIGKQVCDLTLGEWSPLFEISFKTNMLMSIKAITQVILVENGPEISLYVFPLQIHPLASPWPYGTPRDFVGDVWKDCGPFPTIGWPQDTTALEDGCINDEQFLALCRNVDRLRENVLMHEIDRLNQGVLACVFDTLDRVQHMFHRDRPDVIDQWYEELDKLIGRIETRLRGRGLLDKTKILILSDHGFSEFHTKVHLNRWLVDQGYISARANGGTGSLSDVNWSGTQSYAIGLNSIYLNLAGREGKGCVSPGQQEVVVDRLRDDLLQWRDERGNRVINQVWRQREAFDGPLTSYGPDLVVGFSPGFRASAQTGLGEWRADALEPNRDHWGADHCIDPTTVPGVLFTNAAALADYPNPSYRDIPMLTIGMMPDAGSSTPPPTSTATEDDKAIEERLKSLGYL